MSSPPRDLDRLIGAYLEVGPAQMSDRLLEVITADVHRTRQRGFSAPWRNVLVSRFALLAASVVVVVAVVGAALAITRPSSPGTGTPTASPTPHPTALSALVGPIEPGQTYEARGFGNDPFVVKIPTAPAAVTSSPLEASVLVRPGTWGIVAEAGSVTFQDDTPLPKNYCRRSDGLLPDIPATPDAVDAWLRASDGLMVTARTTVTVDGRTAYRWLVTLTDTCDTGPAEGTSLFLSAGEHHGIYAIPTGHDTILAITWGHGYGGDGEEQLPEVNAFAEALIKGMHFP